MKRLSEGHLEHIARITFRKCADIGLKHARENMPYIKKTILELRRETFGLKPAVVVSAGPSLHIQNPAETLIKRGYDGDIVCADGALYYCLRKGLIPDCVLSVDPHPVRMIRLFGDPNLQEAQADDYFRRQDLDPALNKDELARNQEIIALVNKYAKKIKLIISTSVSPAITHRCIEAGMELYWWTPIYDDYNKEGSLTKKIFDMTGVACMATGGNVGTSCWVFANTILRAKDIALVGMDLSYAPGTPLYRTQYYHELKEDFKENFSDAFIEIYNPYLQQTWFSDPPYYWYRESFLELAENTPAKTYNCTEGGVLFGKGIEFIKLDDFLDRFSG